jgi:hypothetical protein
MRALLVGKRRAIAELTQEPPADLEAVVESRHKP